MFSGEQNRVMQTITIKLDLQIEGACSLTPRVCFTNLRPPVYKEEGTYSRWGLGCQAR